jgi:Na+/phosphate symporter
VAKDQTLRNAKQSATLAVADSLDSLIHRSYDSVIMTAATIEQRIEALEEEVRQLRVAVKKGERQQPWWERVGRMFKDDPSV